MSKEVDRSMRDSDTRDLLYNALNAGAIDKQEFDRRMKKLKILSIGDLIKVANHFLAQSPHTSPAPEFVPPSNTPPAMSDHKAEEIPFNQKLLDAMQKGDEVEVQRILFKPNQNEEPAEKL